MVSKKNFSLLNFALLVALVTAPRLFLESFRAIPAFAQSPAPTTFPLPSTVPNGTTVKVDGSSSMAAVNQALKRQFETKYPGTGVNVGYSGSADAIQAVADGKLDLAALGRSLTPEERAKGVTAFPVSRSKIAMLVSNDNPFKGSLTIQQFAKIFRGEIKDWSEVGGAPGPIRFIDRPDTSDTREAFRNYPVFKAAEFKAGPDTTKMPDDSTQAILSQLGKDGISYVTANQLSSLPNVRALLMHNTLPDDPRYPFSQPLSYVYKEGATSPVIAAFLGYAASEEGQKTIEVAQAADPATLPPDLRTLILGAGGAATATALNASPGAASPGVATGAGGATTGTDNVAIAPPPGSNPVAVAPVDPGLPAWLWWLLPLGALGLLAWFWKSRRRAATPPPVPSAPVPPIPPTVEGSDADLAGRTGTIVNSDRAAIAEVNGPAHSLTPLPEEPNPFGGAAIAGGAAAAAAGAAAWANRSAEPEPTPAPLFEETAPAAELEASAPGVELPDVNLPDANVQLPNVELPNVDLPTANVPNVALPNVDLPNVEVPNVDLPNVGLPQAEGGFDLGDAALLGGAGLAAAGGAAWLGRDRPDEEAAIAGDISLPDANVESPELNVDSPELNVDSPELNLDSPELNLDSPELSLDSPELNLDSPELNLDSPELNLDSPELNLDSPEPSVELSIADAESSVTQPNDLGLLDDAALLGGAGLAAGAAAWAARSGSASPTEAETSLPEEVEAIEAQLGEAILSESEVSESKVSDSPTTFDVIEASTDVEPAQDSDLDEATELVLDDESATVIPPEADEATPTIASGYAAAGIAGGAATLTGIAFGGAAGLSALTNQEDQSEIEASKFNVGQTDLSSEVLATVDEGLPELPDGYGESRIVLLPRDPQWAYAYWDVPNEHRQALRDQGGQHIALRLYDVTDLDSEHQSAHSVQEYHCEEMARDWYLPIPVSDRDYILEIGYPTAEGRWLMLARSAPVRIPPVYPSDWQDDQFLTVDWQEDLKGKTLAQLNPPSTQTPIQPNGIYKELFDRAQGTEAQRIAGSLFGSMQQVPQQSISSFITPSGAGAWTLPTPSGMGMSGITMSGVGSEGLIPQRPRNFWLVADAVLIVYGATEPDATLTIGGQVVPLEPDGTFRFQLSFQDGVLDYPIVAVASDGEQNREIQLRFTRETPVRRTNTKEEATDEWFS
jgi:ABC-type phosphate transport system substrate-binding protein